MRVLLVIISMLLAAAPSVAQSVGFDDALPQDPLASERITLWPSVAVRSGVAFALPSSPPDPTYVGPVGYSVGVDVKLNIGHAVAVGLRYMFTHLGTNDGSAGRQESGNNIFYQYIYNQTVSHEILAIAELPFVNTEHLRWSGLLGVGLGIEQVEMQQFTAPDQDGNGIPEDKPEPYQLMKRQDTGPAFALGNALEYFPVDFLSISLAVQAAYRYSEELSFDEGAMILQGLFGVDGHF